MYDNSLVESLEVVSCGFGGCFFNVGVSTFLSVFIPLPSRTAFVIAAVVAAVTIEPARP